MNAVLFMLYIYSQARHKKRYFLGKLGNYSKLSDTLGLEFLFWSSLQVKFLGYKLAKKWLKSLIIVESESNKGGVDNYFRTLRK